MMKTVATILGAILCLTGAIGFMDNDFMRMGLNPLHNVMLLGLGLVAVYFGIKGTEKQARNVNRTVGILFLLLGAATLMAPAGTAKTAEFTIQSDHVLKLIPGSLEYTTADGVRDLLTGLVGVIAGFMPRRAERAVERSAAEAQEKVTSR